MIKGNMDIAKIDDLLIEADTINKCLHVRCTELEFIVKLEKLIERHDVTVPQLMHIFIAWIIAGTPQKSMDSIIRDYK
jgi:hypothetical protein